MTNRNLLELIATQVDTLAKRMDVLTKEVSEIKASMATKEELSEIRASMATKEELSEIRASMATKEELNEIRASMATKEELSEIRASMATKEELSEIRAAMATREELMEIKDIVVKIEIEHGEKLGALLNGYKLHSERLDRLEKKVDRHEDILRKMI